MERLKGFWGQITKSRERIPPLPPAIVVVPFSIDESFQGESGHSWEPGFYVFTNVPYDCWRKHENKLVHLIGRWLNESEDLQEELGPEEEKIKIDVGRENPVDPGKALSWELAHSIEEIGVVLRIERAPVGEVVRVLNIPGIQRLLNLSGSQYVSSIPTGEAGDEREISIS